MIRRALADSQVLVYLGFAEEGSAEELQQSLAELRRRAANRRRSSSPHSRGNASRWAATRRRPPPRPTRARTWPRRSGVDAVEVEELDGRIAQARANLLRVEKQIDARTTALPLFKATIGTESLAGELRARRDHPVHKLLRRMHYEGRA